MKAIVVTLAIGALSHAAPAQAAIYDWIGCEAGDQLGYAVAATGDVDQDGYIDVILGAPFHKNVAGLVYVRSGKDGSTLFRHRGKTGMAATIGRLGFSVDGGRDVDGDGVPDFIYGGLGGINYNWGSVTVASGADGEVIHRETGTLLMGSFYPGFRVLLLDDLGNDGRAEFLSSDPEGGPGASGRFEVWDGLTGASSYARFGQGLNFGRSVSHTPDLSGDGRGDYLVGAPGASFGGTLGEVDLFNSKSGNSQLHLIATELGDEFGWATAGVDDFNTDGKPDILVGAPEAVGGEGRAYLFSGVDGSLLTTLSGGPDDDRFGAALAADGDYDGDGTNDWAVGAPENDDLTPDGGKLTVFSGADGTVLATFLGDAPAGQLGFSVAWAGDVDLGGRCDLLIGAPFTPGAVNPDKGRVLVYRSEPNAGGYCQAKLNSQGCLPRLSASGTPSLSASSFSVAANQLVNQQTAFLFWGTSGPLANPFMGGTKCVLSPVNRIPVLTGGSAGPDDCSGSVDVPWDSAYLTVQGFAPGQTVHTQLWYVDPSASHGVGLSDALQFDVLP